MAGLSRRDLLAGAAALGVAGIACRQVVDAPTVVPSTRSLSPGPSPQRTSPTAAPVPEPSATAVSASPAAVPLVVPMLCRDAWGAAPSRTTEASHVPARLTLHHTAAVLGDNRNAPGRLRQHQRFHLDRGFSDIAYHVGVDRNGNVYELRDPHVPGETFTEYDPSGHFLVLAEGEFDTEVPSDAQLEGLAHVIAAAARGHAIPVDTLTGHRDHAGTACPGDNLYARMADLRARAVQILDEEPELSMWCDERAYERIAAIERGEA
jgi:hypothetical protein